MACGMQGQIDKRSLHGNLTPNKSQRPSVTSTPPFSLWPHLLCVLGCALSVLATLTSWLTLVTPGYASALWSLCLIFFMSGRLLSGHSHAWFLIPINSLFPIGLTLSTLLKLMHNIELFLRYFPAWSSSEQLPSSKRWYNWLCILVSMCPLYSVFCVCPEGRVFFFFVLTTVFSC